MGLRVSKQDGKIKKGKSYQGELSESKKFITPSSVAAGRYTKNSASTLNFDKK
jgi:hypothetical protein